MMRTIQIALGAAISFGLFAMLFFPDRAGETRSASNRCVSRVWQLLVSVHIYATDYDGRLMPTDRWMDVLTPVPKSQNAFNCPTLQDQHKAYGYAMSAYISGANESKFPNQEQIPILHETSTLAKSVSEYLPNFPIPGRHHGWNVVGYLDGHASPIEMPNQGNRSR